MGSLAAQLAGMVLATVLAALFSSLGAMMMIGISGVWLSLAAATVSLPVGVVIVLYFFRFGLSPESIVVATMMRVFLTAVLAGFAVLLFTELRVSTFFLALGVIYLANLSVETWFALRLKS